MQKQYSIFIEGFSDMHWGLFSVNGWLKGYQSTRHTVISSHGHVVTRSTRHWSTRHRHVSSHRQLVTTEHITKPPVPVVIICRPSASGDIQKQCSTRMA